MLSKTKRSFLSRQNQLLKHHIICSQDMERPPSRSSRSKSPQGWLSRPFTRSNLYGHYMPIAGCLSYHLFSLNIYLPRELSRYVYLIIILSKIMIEKINHISSTRLFLFLLRMFPAHHVIIANGILFNSHLGIGLYLYTRTHMKLLSIPRRVIYSAYGAILFNFGSILLWATTKSLLPKSPFIRVLLALTSSFGLLTIGKQYIEFIDKSI